MSAPVIIYLHGFLSSPQSAKARATAAYLRERERMSGSRVFYQVPALPEEPELALAAAEHAVTAQRAARAPSIGLIGSSMGGFYATVLAQRHGLRAVLVNPSVAPQRSIRRYLGQSIVNPYSGREFALDERHAAELAQMAPSAPTNPDDFWLLAQRGDEVLDYREAELFYAGCRQTIEPGGDHQFQGFERHLPAIVDFLAG